VEHRQDTAGRDLCSRSAAVAGRPCRSGSFGGGSGVIRIRPQLAQGEGPAAVGDVTEGRPAQAAVRASGSNGDEGGPRPASLPPRRSRIGGGWSHRAGAAGPVGDISHDPSLGPAAATTGVRGRWSRFDDPLPGLPPWAAAAPAGRGGKTPARAGRAALSHSLGPCRK